MNRTEYLKQVEENLKYPGSKSSHEATISILASLAAVIPDSTFKEIMYHPDSSTYRYIIQQIQIAQVAALSQAKNDIMILIDGVSK